MINLDAIEKEKGEIVARMNAAIEKNDAAAFQAEFGKLCENIEKGVLEKAKGIVDANDQKVLSERGVRQLTSKETEYYQKLIDAMKAENPRQAVDNLDIVMPYTVIDAVFDDLRTNHPLLSKIQFRSVTGITKMMMNTNGYQKAAWGKLCAAITQELTSGFREIDVTLNKLSAFLPVCKAMLDLGPQWLDRYVREVLYEAFANGLEDGIVNGTGKEQPIGMMRQVGDNVTVTGGVYPEKDVIQITQFDNVQLGKIASVLAINEKGQARTVSDLILVVNPADYFSRVLPATQYPAPGGGYVSALPFAIDVIQSAAVPVGKAVFGMARLYFMGSGIENNGRIQYSDDYHFLEDERVYLIKGYAHGFAMDNNAFVVFDITGLQPARYKVEVISDGAGTDNADLNDLRLSGHTLTPVFDASTTAYTATTDDASNTVTAVQAKASAAVEITANGKAVANGSRINWEAGENTVTVKVTDGAAEKTYTLTVTKGN